MLNQDFWDFLRGQGVSLPVNVDAEFGPSLEKYLHLLLEKNKLVNLTAIRDPNDAIWKHLADSLVLAKWEGLGSLLDWGSGGGLPGIPLALLRKSRGESAPVAFLDSVGKKIKAIEEFGTELGITSLYYNERGEKFLASPDSSGIQTIVMRAVAPPAEVIEWMRPSVSHWVMMLGSQQMEVWNSLKGRAANRGFVFGKVAEYELPHGLGKRFLLELKSKRST